jgi:hypothetical protein
MLQVQHISADHARQEGMPESNMKQIQLISL